MPNTTHRSGQQPEPVAYTPSLGNDPSTASVLANNVIGVQDIYVFTPLRNVQVFLQDVNFIYAAPVVHEVFLVTFFLGVAASLIQTGLSFFGINRSTKTISELLKNLPYEERSITESETDTEAETETETAALALRKIRIHADAYIHDPENNYQKTYAVLLYDETLKQYVVGKRVLEEESVSLSAEERENYLKELALAWQKAAQIKPKTPVWKDLSAGTIFESGLKFFFKMSLWYWILWFIAAGFVGFNGATLIAFSSPVLAFVLPVALTLIEYAINAIAAYRNRHNAADPKLNNLVENLLRIKLAETVINTPAISPTEKSFQELKEWATAESMRDPKLAELMRENALEVSASQKRGGLRVLLNTLTKSTSIFIMISFIAWPLTDFLGIQGISVGALFAGGAVASAISLAIVPMMIAILGGLVFAVLAYKNSVAEENARVAKLKTDPLIALQKQFNDVVLEVRLRRAYLQSQGVNTLSPASMENPQFEKHFKIEVQGFGASMGTKVRRFLHRSSLLIAAMGTGTLIVRLFVATVVSVLAPLGLLGSFSYLSAAVIVPVVALGLIWGGISLLQFYQQRRWKAAEQRLINISTELEIYTRENAWLKQQEATLTKPVPASPANRGAAADAAIHEMAPSPASSLETGTDRAPSSIDIEAEDATDSEGESDREPLCGRRNK